MENGKHFEKNNKKRIGILYLIFIISIIMLIFEIQDKNTINNDEKYNEIANDNSQVETEIPI